MSTDIKTEIRIPDLWFDFYARLLPGSTFAAGVRTFIIGNYGYPEGREILVLAFLGYVSALLSQSLSARLTGWIEDRVAQKYKSDHLFIRKLQRQLGSSSRQALLLSKMHGEVTFFTQLFVLGSLLLALQLCATSSTWHTVGINLLCLFISASSAVEVALRRHRRAQDLAQVLAEIPKDDSAADFV